jgi:hypothetical protein
MGRISISVSRAGAPSGRSLNADHALSKRQEGRGWIGEACRHVIMPVMAITGTDPGTVEHGPSRGPDGMRKVERAGWAELERRGICSTGNRFLLDFSAKGKGGPPDLH